MYRSRGGVEDGPIEDQLGPCRGGVGGPPREGVVRRVLTGGSLSGLLTESKMSKETFKISWLLPN